MTGAEHTQLLQVLQMADLISPWSVGRYQTNARAQEDAATYVKGDLAWCNQRGITLMPVIFPGASFHNSEVSDHLPNPEPLDWVPRKQNGVYFFHVQGQAIANLGVRTIYIAMFDEVNEGTAIFKCTQNPPSTPDGLHFVPYR